MTQDMMYKTEDGQTFDMERFSKFIDNRKKVLEELVTLHENLGNEDKAQVFKCKLMEMENVSCMMNLCRKETEMHWFVDGTDTGLCEDATAEEFIAYLQEHISYQWRDNIVRFTCERYDNPDDARDRLWDALVEDDPMEDLVELVMDDIRALRKAEVDAKDSYGDNYFIQLGEVDA